jgi:hypothetical protein
MSQLYSYSDSNNNMMSNSNDYLNTLNQSHNNGISMSYSNHNMYHNNNNNNNNMETMSTNDYNILSSGANDLVYNPGYIQSTVNQIASDLLQLNDSRALSGLRAGSSYEQNGTMSSASNLSGILSSVEAAILRSTIPIDINEVF